jgi:flavin reductase (DIM6/NTAB) family NADH-FMN oxidoreductase RutF
MDLDMYELSQGARYKLLTALVIPRPIAWVSSLNEDGSVNLAPYSFFNVLGNRPPLVALGPGYKPDGSPKDTRLNIERNGLFVINMVDRELADVMHKTAAPFPADVSEASALGIQMTASVEGQVPGVVDSKVRLSCKYERTVVIGENQVVFGIVEKMWILDGLLDPTNLHLKPGAFSGVGRLQGPGWYCTSDDRFDLGGFPPVDK